MLEILFSLWYMDEVCYVEVIMLHAIMYMDVWSFGMGLSKLVIGKFNLFKHVSLV